MDQTEKTMSQEIFNGITIVLAEQGRVAPVYFIVKDKKMNPIMGYPGDITMQQLANMSVNMAHEADADAVVLVCEQWMVKMKQSSKEAQDYIDGTKRPSESPDAKPYLTLTHMSKIGVVNCLIGEILTSPNGVNFVRDSEWISKSTTNMITPWASEQNFS